MTTPLLEVRNATKTFPGVKALDDVSLEIRPNEVVGLIGENGAGKSTVLKVLVGINKLDSGEVLIGGEPVRIGDPGHAAKLGIGMVHQEQSLIGTVSVAENILLGAEGNAVRAGFFNWPKMYANAQRQLDKIGSKIRPQEKTEHLTFAQRQMAELAKALYVEERSSRMPVIILDEPSSVLEGEDLEVLFQQVERLRQIASVIFVSHRLDEVIRVSDRVYVMKDGAVMAERSKDEIDVPELYRLMVGRESSGGYYREEDQLAIPDDAKPVLEISGLTTAEKYHDIDLTVREGEVVGLAGVVGSGREDLCRAIFGAEPFDTGTITFNGKPRKYGAPADAVRDGIGFIPAERRLEGVAIGLSVGENILLADQDPIRSGPFISPKKRDSFIRKWVERLKVKTPSVHTDVGKLSGGNQQKVAPAKWMGSPKLKLLILDHPTPGLDVGAKQDVFAFIRDIAKQGLGIILLADTLEETISLSHRIVVFRDGAVTAEFDAQPGNKAHPGGPSGGNGMSTTTEAKPKAKGLGSNRQRLTSFLPVVILVVLVVAIGISQPSFLGPMSLRTLLESSAPIMLLALAQMFVILTGGIDLSSATLTSLGTVLLALWIKDLGVLGIIAMVVVISLAGTLNGVVASVAQVPAFVVTLGSMGLWSGVALGISGASTISVTSNYDLIGWLTSTRFADVALSVYVAVGLMVLVWVAMRFLTKGNSIHALVLAERASLMSGMRTRAVRILALTLSDFFSALAAIVLVSSQYSGAPTLADALQMVAIASVVVGGCAITGGVGGPFQVLVGALIIGVLRVGMSILGVLPAYEQIVYGLLVIVSVAISIDRSRLDVVK
ncbi:ATP-binding cassette domain-containing protein [uncultured Tessaracoccus sp.]|uniref:ATP-binding cassette domain-containing protein n=1 Tax=uncultured Tessaracoccus sp. TaxID=905023 RepID=UPI00261E9EE2|nr:ATP-binding cassette domain-containing protein [uncultured Tessaracoccus sp.]